MNTYNACFTLYFADSSKKCYEDIKVKDKFEINEKVAALSNEAGATDYRIHRVVRKPDPVFSRIGLDEPEFPSI